MAQVYTSNVVVKPFAVGLAQPVDVRTIVSTLADLVKKDTFNSIQKICAGMPIAVVESGKSGLWMLPDATAYSTLQNAMLQSSWADPTEVTEEVVLSKGWVKLQTSAEVDAKLSELSETIGGSVSGVSTDVEALKLIVNGEVGEDGTVIKASLQDQIDDIDERVTSLEDTVNGKGETPSLQSQITANANAIATLSGKVTYNIVESLPTENIDPNIFYLVLDSEAAEDGETFYKEYLYVNNEWELVGTTHTSLDGYITETDAKNYADAQAAQALADAKADTTAQITALNLATTYAPISVVETAEGAADKADENAGKIAALETTVNGAEGTTGLVARVGTLEDYKTTHDGLYNSLNQQVSTNTGAIETINNNLGSYLTKSEAGTTYETIENVAALTKTVGDNKTAADTGIQEAKDLAQQAIDGLADKVTNNSLATTLANYQTQDLTITDFDTGDVQATVESALLANKNAMAANATAISGLSGRMEAVEALAGNAATKESVEALAGEQGRVTVVEGKVSTLEGVVGDAEGGLVKDVADLAANKADASTVESTYLKKSGDSTLDLTDKITVAGTYAEEYVEITGEYVKVTDDVGTVLIENGGINISNVLTVSNSTGEEGISGSAVDTVIPETPVAGHIATTGAIKTYVDAEVSAVKASVATAYTFKGSKTYAEISAITDAKVGDVYNSTTEVTLSGVKYPVGTNFAWDGISWEPLSGTIDVSAYATTESVDGKLEAQAESFQGIIDGVETEVEKKVNIAGDNLGTLSATQKASWKSALGFATADDQVQSDWNVTDTSSKAYIANKPAIRRISRNNGIQIGDDNSAQNVVQYDTYDTDTEYYGINKIYRGVSADPTVAIAIEACDQGEDICFTVTAHYIGKGKVRYEVTEFNTNSEGITWEVSKEVLHNAAGNSVQIPNLEISAEEDSNVRYIKFPQKCVYEIQTMFVAY